MPKKRSYNPDEESRIWRKPEKFMHSRDNTEANNESFRKWLEQNPQAQNRAGPRIRTVLGAIVLIYVVVKVLLILARLS